MKTNHVKLGIVGRAPLIVRAALAGCGLLISPAGVDARATLTTIEVSGQSTAVYGMNDAGVITGTYDWDTGFLRTPDGTITSFDIPGAGQTVSIAINNNGLVAGNYSDASGVWWPFIRNTDGSIVSYQVPGALNAHMGAMNDAGTIAGYWNDSKELPHIFVRSADGTITTYDIPDATIISVSGINARGYVVGYYYDHTADHGFLMAPNGAITTIDAPDNGGETILTGINDKGVIVGWSYAHGGFVREADGTFRTIACPEGGTSCLVYSVNNKEKVAGSSYVPARNTYVGFMQASTGRTRTFHPGHERDGIVPQKINANGWIAGFYWLKQSTGSGSGRRSSIPVGFLWVP